MNYKHILLLSFVLSLFTGMPAFSAPPGAPPSAGPPSANTQSLPPQYTGTTAPQHAGQLQSFAFEGAPLELVLQEYCRWTGKMYLKTDTVSASITLKAENITTEESIKVVEAILAMNNIALVPMGDRYIKVLLANAPDLLGHGLSISTDPGAKLEISDRFITQIIPINNATIPEVQAAVQHVMHSYGKIMALQRSNSLMITDTEATIMQAREIIEFIDQATSRIESKIYEIKYSDSGEISSKLNEIIMAAQETEGGAGSATINRPPQLRTAAQPAIIRAPLSQTESSPASIIQGTVKVLSDERTNILMIFSQKENFAFFDEIIKVLDVEVEPAVSFEVVSLEYADAEELSGTLNELIGATQRSSSSRSSASSSTSTQRTPAGVTRARRTSSQPTSRTPASASALENLSYLSEDTKVLSDERSNSILLMGKATDIAAIKNVIKSLDIMLEQVLIEAVIFEVQLDDNLEHGIQWFYDRSAQDDTAAGWGGNALSLLGSMATNALAPTANSLTYYQTFRDFDLKAAVRLLKTDSNAKLLSTPVVMTTDNTEASITIGEQRPIVTSTDSTLNSNQQRSNYEYKDIGIQLTVTPHINPQRFVVMEINQKADQLGGTVLIDEKNEVPIILNREIEASIAVPDRGTIALGGLITTDETDTLNKIPILGDIPLIGRYLFSSVRKTDIRRELLVLMTPYVLTNPEEMAKETERLYKGTAIEQDDWPEGQWSQSPLQLISDDQKKLDSSKRMMQPAPAQQTQDDMQELMQEMSNQ